MNKIAQRRREQRRKYGYKLCTAPNDLPVIVGYPHIQEVALYGRIKPGTAFTQIGKESEDPQHKQIRFKTPVIYRGITSIPDPLYDDWTIEYALFEAKQDDGYKPLYISFIVPIYHYLHVKGELWLQRLASRDIHTHIV